MKKTVIYGSGGLGREMLEIVMDINKVTPRWEIMGFIDDGVRKGELVNGIRVLGGIEYLSKYQENIAIIFGIADTSVKTKLYNEIKNFGKNFDFPIIIHNTAYVSSSVCIQEGVVIGRFCFVSIDTRLGKCVFLNTRCDIGHDSQIGDFSSLMPSVNVSGNVTVGEKTLIGVQSAILQGVKIGSGVTVGMGSKVMADVPDNCTVMGYPARIIAKHEPKENRH